MHVAMRLWSSVCLVEFLIFDGPLVFIFVQMDRVMGAKENLKKRV